MLGHFTDLVSYISVVYYKMESRYQHLQEKHFY